MYGTVILASKMVHTENILAVHCMIPHFFGATEPAFLIILNLGKPFQRSRLYTFVFQFLFEPPFGYLFYVYAASVKKI